MLSVMVPVKVCLAWAAERDTTKRRTRIKGFITSRGRVAAGLVEQRRDRRIPTLLCVPSRLLDVTRCYSPGVMRCAVVVPAFMIHTPPPRPFSGRPIEGVVAPGTA